MRRWGRTLLAHVTFLSLKGKGEEEGEMSCEAYEAGTKVEAVAEIAVRVNMGAPVEGDSHMIRVGDIGEITTVRRTGAGLHWLVIRWQRLGRSFNLNPDQFDRVKIAG